MFVKLPPIHHDTPRFSTSTSHNAAELAAVALVRESPTAATISMSPAKFHRNTDFKITPMALINRLHIQSADLDVNDEHCLALFHFENLALYMGMADDLAHAFAGIPHSGVDQFHLANWKIFE